MSESSAEEEAKGRSTAPAPTTLAEFWHRILEHKVLHWGIAYLGAALAIAHGAELVGTTFHWPEFVNRVLMSVLIVGLPIVVTLAWYHGHRHLRSVGAGEATIISLLILIGAGLLMVFVRGPEGGSREGESRTTTTSHDASVTPEGSAGSKGPLSASRESQSAAAVPSGPSIAVLPFVNMSSDKEQEYFSDGLSEELLNQLAHVPHLRVIGRTSSFAFKGKSEDLRAIGRTLGVDHILEGSVRKAGNRIRITAQLIDPASGSHLWSDVYDKELGDVFAIQEGIARTVASQLRLEIGNDLGDVTTHNVAAYDEFLRGRQEGAGPGSNIQEAIRHLTRAVELDPQFTAAWTMLVQAYSGAIVNLPDRTAEWLAKQDVALSRAVALAPQSASVKLVLGSRELGEGHLAKAEQLLPRLGELPPGLALDGYLQYALFQMGVGRPRDAIDTLTRARQAEPLAPFPSLLLQIAYETAGDVDAADAEYQRAPGVGGSSDVARGTAVVRAMARRDVAAVRKAVEAQSADQGAEVNRAMIRLSSDPRAALSELSGIFKTSAPTTYGSAIIAQWAAYFGDADLSLQALRSMPRTGAGGGTSILFSLWRPVEKDVRRSPGFKVFVQDLGLVDYWRTTGKWGEFCHPTQGNGFECT